MKKILIISTAGLIIYFLFFFGWESEVGLDHWPESLPIAESCEEYKIPKDNEGLYNFIMTAKESNLDRGIVNCVLAKSKYNYSHTIPYETMITDENFAELYKEGTVTDVIVRSFSGLTFESKTNVLLAYDKQNKIYWFDFTLGDPTEH